MPRSARSSGTSSRSQTAKIPCGVTVSERLAAARSVIRTGAGPRQVGVAHRGGVGDEQLAHLRVAQRLPDGLGALDEKPPRPVAAGAAQQLAGCDHARGAFRAGRFDLGLARCGQAAEPFAGWVGRFALATSTSAANAAASVTAMSASTLRSTSTPAALRPCMKRL